jgi:uncharacterized phage protein gp47/JayE
MFSRPSLQTLINRARADVQSRLTVEELLRRNDPDVLAVVMAATAHGLYGYLDWQSRQLLPDTADTEILDRFASLWLDQARKPATAAIGDLALTGIDGSVVPTGTALVRSSGLEYVTTADATISAGVATVSVQASTTGAETSAPAGETLTFVSPIVGVNSTATVATLGLTDASDIEDDSALRARILARIKEPPHGGSAADYEAWALEVAGVTRAWVYPLELGPGTVTVRFVRDDDASLIPDVTEVAAVQTYIDARRPVTAQVTVVAPVAVPLNFTIFVTPNTADVKAAVTAELTDLLRREAVPGGTILLSHIREAISIATGETNHTISVPAADVAHTTGQIATMGTITWA